MGLQVLGDDVEPCFEGAGIAAQFSFDDEFKNNLFAMMEELKTALQEGGETQMDNENIILEGEEQEIVDPVTEPETEFKKKPVFELIEPSASSTSELVSEMLEQILPKDMLTHNEANLLLAGIMLDTKSFSMRAGVRTFEAAAYLKKMGADTVKVKELFSTIETTFLGKIDCHFEFSLILLSVFFYNYSRERFN